LTAEGSFSDGLMITALPAAMASGTNHIGTIAGKLKGEITPTTPSGWNIEKASTLVETFSEWPPLSRWGIPQANSTTSRPRVTSPTASAITLPCSAVMISAIRCLFLFSSSRKANMTRVRRVREVAPHSLAALAARATTSSTRSLEARSTMPVTCPVAGLKTGDVRSETPVQYSWPIRWVIRVGCAAVSAAL